MLCVPGIGEDLRYALSVGIAGILGLLGLPELFEFEGLWGLLNRQSRRNCRNCLKSAEIPLRKHVFIYTRSQRCSKNRDEKFCW